MKKIIVLSFATIAMLTFTGCNNNKADDSSKSAVETTKEAASDTASAAKAVVSKTAQSVQNTAEQAEKKVADVATKTAKKAVETTKEVATATANTAKKAAAATKEAAAKVVEKTEKAVAATATAVAGGNEKGKAIFAKCQSCHGVDGKTKALGKSAIIAGQPAADLEKKMAAYKAGTRNETGMGMLMKGQVGALSDDEIKAVAEYISSLK